MNKPTSLTLTIFTPIFLLLAHYLAVFPHEYAHSTMAWLLGDKQNPLMIEYGGTSWSNLLLLLHIDENVDYASIIAHGHLFHIALIGFAGPGIANGLLYLISLYLLAKHTIQQKPLLYYFIFWFNFMNIANFYDYVPIRVFGTHGDMNHISVGLGISPWIMYGVFGYAVAFIIWHFFTRTLAQAFHYLNLTTTFSRASLMIGSTLILFGYFALPGFFGYGNISYFISGTSLLLIPGIIISCWPTPE